MAQKLGGDMLRGGSELGEASSSKVGAIVKEGGDETSFQVLGMFDRDSRSFICYHPPTKKFRQMQKFDKKMMHCRFTTVVIDDHIYAFNGDKSVYRLEYTDMNAIWHRMADTNEDHGWVPPAAALDGFIYVIGSPFYENKTASSEKFDPRTNTWSRIKDVNIARTGNSVVACKGFIYSFGGYSESFDRLTSVERFDPRTGEWSHVASMNQSVYNPTVVEHNDKIYVIDIRSVECYDPDQDAWTTVMTHDRLITYNASVVDGNIYTVDCMSDELLMLNMTEKKWESVANLPRYSRYWQVLYLNMPNSLIGRLSHLPKLDEYVSSTAGFRINEQFASYDSGVKIESRGVRSKVSKIPSRTGIVGSSLISSGYYSGSSIGSSKSKFLIWDKGEKLFLNLTKKEKLKERVSQPPYIISHEQIIKPVGGTIVLPGCTLRFRKGSFKKDCTVKLTLRFDKSQCPDKYSAICPFLDCEFSEPLLKPVSVELETICSATISESSDILVDVLHQNNGSKEWDHVATLPLSHSRVVKFECNDFSPLFVGIKRLLAKWFFLTFTLKGYLYAGKEGNISVVLFVNHSVIDAQITQEYRERPGMLRRLAYGPLTINIGDTVMVELDLAGMQKERFRFVGRREFSIIFTTEFIGNIYESSFISIEPVNQTNIPHWVGLSSKLFLKDNLVPGSEQTFNINPGFHGSSPQAARRSEHINALVNVSGGNPIVNMRDLAVALGENPNAQQTHPNQ